MKLHLISVRSRKIPASSPEAELISRYIERASKYLPATFRTVASGAALLDLVAEEARRTNPFLVLTDSRGKQLSSEDLASAIGNAQDSGTQQLIVAIGPADGWSQAALDRANLLVAFGKITLPHELAAAVAAEQLYRALTIRAGHPYHSGH